MISVDEAQEIILNNVRVLSTIDINIKESNGHILVKDVHSEEAIPAFPASIKDGYAVIASDGPGTYPVIENIYAGNEKSFELKKGNVAYIATGASVPKGSDAVVMIENTEKVTIEGKQYIKILKQVQSGTDIRAIGSDISIGCKILSKGDMIGAAEIGLLSMIGCTNVNVYQKPKIAILSNGDEIVDCNVKELKIGQVRDSNGPMLIALSKETESDVTDLGIISDIENELNECIKNAIQSNYDIIISSGGVSVGKKDYVKEILKQNGIIHFEKVKMKPGKPLTFATLKNKDKNILFYGLPGNPASSFVCFQLFVLPAIRKMIGNKNPMQRRIEVTTLHDINLDAERPEYARAIVKWQNDHFIADKTGSQISSRLLSAKSANVLLELPQREGMLVAGSKIKAILIDDLRKMPIE